MTVQSSGGADTAGAPGVGVQAVRLIGRVWAWLFLLALIAFFTATAPHFFDLFNFQAMGANTAIVLVLALGQTFVIITGGIDLSVGYVMGLATVVISLIMQNMVGYPLPVALLAGMAGGLGVGITAGLFNGFWIAYVGLPSLAVTLAGLIGYRGVARILVEDHAIGAETPAECSH